MEGYENRDLFIPIFPVFATKKETKELFGSIFSLINDVIVKTGKAIAFLEGRNCF
jgi:hypothetical protein